MFLAENQSFEGLGLNRDSGMPCTVREEAERVAACLRGGQVCAAGTRGGGLSYGRVCQAPLR